MMRRAITPPGEERPKVLDGVKNSVYRTFLALRPL
jgi:hypothetical protein